MSSLDRESGTYPNVVPTVMPQGRRFTGKGFKWQRAHQCDRKGVV